MKTQDDVNMLIRCGSALGYRVVVTNTPMAEYGRAHHTRVITAVCGSEQGSVMVHGGTELDSDAMYRALEMAYRQVGIWTTVQFWHKCPDCDGSGDGPDDDYCEMCQGRGGWPD